jgi:hypothetical protein
MFVPKFTYTQENMSEYVRFCLYKQISCHIISHAPGISQQDPASAARHAMRHIFYKPSQRPLPHQFPRTIRIKKNDSVLVRH